MPSITSSFLKTIGMTGYSPRPKSQTPKSPPKTSSITTTGKSERTRRKTAKKGGPAKKGGRRKCRRNTKRMR